MKKIAFLRLVCIELARMGVGEDEIKIQCSNIHKYLTSMGIGEESPVLDSENPAAFAKLIYGNIAKKQNAKATKADLAAEAPVQPEEQSCEFSDEMPEIETIDAPDLEAKDETNDIKIFDGSHSAPVIDDLPPESDTPAPEEASVLMPRLDEKHSDGKARAVFMIKAPQGTRAGYVSEYMAFRDRMIENRAPAFIEIDINPYGSI